MKKPIIVLPKLLLLLAVGFLLKPAALEAQSSPDGAYWYYSAARRLTHVQPVDVNRDGTDELLLVTENGKIDLISAHSAQLQWSYLANGAVQAISVINVNAHGDAPVEIALVVNDQLVLLDARGEELWRLLLTAVESPPADTNNLPVTADEAVQSSLNTRQILPFDSNGDGRDEILILFDNGQLHLYDGSGTLLYRIHEHAVAGANTQPVMQVGDLNQDGQPEIVLGIFNPEQKFSQLFLFEANGHRSWADAPAPALSGHITALTLVPFGPGGDLQIAVGTDWGQLHLYDANRQRQWWARTLNKPITALATAHFPEGPALLAGTDAGMVVAYSGEGRRYWTRRLTLDAEHPVIGLSTTFPTTESRSPVLAVLLGPHIIDGGNQQIKLLDASGLEVDEFEAGEGNTPLSRLLDINGDQRSELLLVRFATVELHGLGFGASETAKEWDYLLDAAPGAMLVVDFDKDGHDELLLGAENGKLHYLINGNTLEWKHAPGGAITHLALLERAGFPEPIAAIVVGRNDTAVSPGEPALGQSWLGQSWVELRHTNGERIWEVELNAHLTDLLVVNGDETDDPEIIVSTVTGDIVIINVNGVISWQTTLPPDAHETIQQLLLIEAPNGLALLVAATIHHLYVTPVGSTLLPRRTGTFDSAPIQKLFRLHQPGIEQGNRLLVLNDQAHGLNWRGIPLPSWPLPLNGLPLAAIHAPDPLQETLEISPVESFLISTTENELLWLTITQNKPEIVWTSSSLPNLTALYWGDLDGNRLPEFAIGDQSGKVRLFTNVLPAPKYLDELSLSSGVFAMTALRRGQENRADLLVVTENGEVQLFSAQKNRPPLLSNPTVEVSPGQYTFNIFVTDVEEDEVKVRLDIQNPATGGWQSYRELTLANGNGPVFWNVSNPPVTDNAVHYRFYYDDNIHTGIIYPPAGPPPLMETQFLSGYALGPLLVGASSLLLLLLTRQALSSAMRMRRFYWRLKRWPVETLLRLESRYVGSKASPDFLLALSGLARQRNDELISELADGLYLLADRPQAGLPLIRGALDKASQFEPGWLQLERWQLMLRIGQELLDAPSLTELSLEWSRLQELLAALERAGYWSPSLFALLPALTTIRDGERVERTDDRLVYLREAAEQLAAVCQDLPEYDTAVEKPLTLAIANRWAGLVSAETEELRGRAELVVTLKTRRILPGEPTALTFEISNDGRAPAENVIVMLDEDPAYSNGGLPEAISFIPPGQTRAITFDIRPQVTDRFRVGLTVSYDDRNQRDKTIAFGDQVYLLLPQRDFLLIPNPYRPGTPLRQKSTVFYGREWLFHFIADNAGNWTQRNVLILIGQRRTGKTSALLNLEQHLPEHLLPVYIDCQSLGVLPGMAALFHDWAWLIADALATRGLHVEVPEMAVWEADPVRQLQRHFLPTARAALPPDATLLLVFDEFEVFENLVDDGLLPPTFFNFLRHLMQHSEGLSFVFVGTRHLQEMSADYWSVMFNIALYQHITCLREEPALQLITEPVAPYLVYDDLALAKILRVTAGHPYFLQLVCYTLVKQANQQRKGYVTISDVNAALDEMLTLGEVHFAYLWQRSSYTEQAILTAVSHMTDSHHAFRPEEFVQFLAPYGIHLHPKEVTTALNTLVEREIMREVRDGATTQYELRLGLVGLWAAQHKSLSKLHAAAPVNGARQNGKQRVRQQVTSGMGNP